MKDFFLASILILLFVISCYCFEISWSSNLEMSSSFSFPQPITTADDLEDLHQVYGVDRSVVLDLASASETPETVRRGYCGVYLPFFQSCGLSFRILEPVLEILAELGLSFTQICPKFLRHLVSLLVRAREEGLWFGLGEFWHLVLVKRNQQNPGTFLVSPCPGRHVIEDVPYRDEKWRKLLKMMILHSRLRMTWFLLLAIWGMRAAVSRLLLLRSRKRLMPKWRSQVLRFVSCFSFFRRISLKLLIYQFHLL